MFLGVNKKKSAIFLSKWANKYEMKEAIVKVWCADKVIKINNAWKVSLQSLSLKGQVSYFTYKAILSLLL